MYIVQIIDNKGFANKHADYWPTFTIGDFTGIKNC